MIRTPRFTLSRFAAPRAALLGMLLLTSACSYIKRDDFDSEIARLRQEVTAGDERVSDEVAALDTRLRARMDGLQTALRDIESEFGARVDRLETSLKVHAPVHFGFDEVTLDEDQIAVLERLAAVLREHYPEALVTVEGFTDAVGSASYNLRLGRQRAEEVRGYLVTRGGLSESQVRAVSYGEAIERQVVPGAAGPGEAGRENRRAVIVIDHPTPGWIGDAATEE